MRIGRTFTIPNANHTADTFVVLSSKCISCRRRFRIVVRQHIAQEVFYGKDDLKCFRCANYWVEIMATLAGITEVGGPQFIVFDGGDYE